MAVDIHKLIAAVSPDLFCDPSVRSKVKKIAKQKGYLTAAKEAKPQESQYVDVFDEELNHLACRGLSAPTDVSGR